MVSKNKWKKYVEKKSRQCYRAEEVYENITRLKRMSDWDVRLENLESSNPLLYGEPFLEKIIKIRKYIPKSNKRGHKRDKRKNNRFS